MVFYYIFADESDEMASVQITNEHMERWKVTLEEINETAMKNTPSVLEAVVSDMFDILKNNMKVTDFDEWRSDVDYIPMYVVSNRRGVNGAACMMYPGLMADISERLDSDLFIIPSSVHELIVVPVKRIEECERYDEMIRYVNKTQLAQTDILSDHVYYYTREKRAVAFSV